MAHLQLICRDLPTKDGDSSMANCYQRVPIQAQPSVSRPDHPGLDAGGPGQCRRRAELGSVADAAPAAESATGADAADDQTEACPRKGWEEHNHKLNQQ